MSADTIHGVALNIAGNGLLILGPSGSGKTGLALDLIDHCQARGIDAHLVADDRIIMRNVQGDWFASAPELL
jgi:serine kinase of HPr protein (carbohydrate metabolism regulator)